MTDERVVAASRGGWWGAGWVFSALFLALVSPIWLGRVLPQWDGLDFYLPAVTYISDSLHDGRFPLWDPFTNGGEPFHADPQRLVLNPLALLLARVLSDPILAFGLVWTVHWWGGGLGMLWLARRFGASPPAAVAAAAAYALSGFFVAHAEHVPYLIVAAWLPAVIGLADDAVARRRRSSVLLAAAALALCAVGGGYPMLVAFTGFATALWLALRFVAFVPEEERARRGNLAVWVIGTLGAMAAILAVTWLPLLHAFLTEAAPFTVRLTTVAAETAIDGSPFSLRAALSLLFPYATIFLFDHKVEMYADISMLDAYVGFATIPLAATWVGTTFRERRTRAIAAFAAVMLLASLGGVGGVRYLLHHLLPPLKFMRFNAPFRLYWILPLCLGAALGLTRVVGDAGARRLFFRVAAAWAAIAVAAGAILHGWLTAAGISLEPGLPWLVLPLAAAAPATLGLAWWSSRGGRSAPRWLGAALAAIVCADVGAHLYVNRSTVWTGDEDAVRSVRALHRPSTARGADPGSRRLNNPTFFNAHLLRKEPLLGGYTSFQLPEFNSFLFNSRFREVLCGPARFWLAPSAEPMPDRRWALRELAFTGAGMPAPVFLERPAAIVSEPARVVPGTWGVARVETFRPEEIALAVLVPGRSPAILTSTERLAPGWKVWVDGHPAEPLRTNLFFRGVVVPPGEHRVIWRYQPDAWWPLVVLGAAAWLATVGAALVLRARERLRCSDDPPPEAATGALSTAGLPPAS